VANDGEQRWATGSRVERSETCVRRKESGGGAPAMPMREDKAARPRGTALTGSDRHWHHHHAMGAVTGGDRPIDVRRWD
jgi:hypothetical protein